MKKYFLPSALILVLGLGLALAQNITKSVQLSQDPTGTIGYDTSQNVYFPAHILSQAQAVPTVSTLSGGATSTIATTSSDFQGAVTGGGTTSTAGAALTFKTAYLSAPNCVLVSGAGSASTLAWTTATTGINITSAIGSGVINYLCSGTR